jgi:hypothetical protein
VGHMGGVIVTVFVCGRSWVTDPVGQASSVVDRGLQIQWVKPQVW